MLNYNDNEATLREFYGVQDLDEPVVPAGPVSGAALLQDPLALAQLPVPDQYDALEAKLPQRTVPTTPTLRDPLMGADLTPVVGPDPAHSRFLILSQQFDPQAYLAVVHRDTPIEQLVDSLNRLDASIRVQTSELKKVLHENYASFLASKRFLDDILGTFYESKSLAQKVLARSNVYNPAKQKKVLDDKSILAELEASVNSLNLLSSLMIRPIKEHAAREAKVSLLIAFMKENKFIFDLPHKFVEYLAAQDHDQLIEDYNRFLKEYAALNARQQRELAAAEDKRATKSLHTLQNTALARVYDEIAKIAAEFRTKSLQNLLSMDYTASTRSSRRASLDVKFIDLVDKLNRMSPALSGHDPIAEFLHSQLGKIRSELDTQHDKFSSRFGAMQKRLQEYITSFAEHRDNGSFVKHIGEKFDHVEEFFRASSSYTSLEINLEMEQVILEVFESSDNLDLSIINETWLILFNYICYLENFVNKTMSKFVNNYVHYCAPQNDAGIDAAGHLRDEFFQIIAVFSERLMSIFGTQAPTEQTKVSPANYVSFLPHHTNSLSTIFYSSTISESVCSFLTQLGKYSTQIGNCSKAFDTNKQIRLLRDTSTAFDQTLLEAICATWVNDCSQFYDLEDWQTYQCASGKPTRGIIYTKLMQMIHYYELFVLEKLKELLVRGTRFNSDVRIVSLYPSKRILVSLEIQFMRSMNVLLDSSVKKFAAEKAAATEDLAQYAAEKSVYKVLTMNNFTALGSVILPRLIRKFDLLFDKSLHKQNLKLFADLDKVKITILDDVNEIEKGWLEARVEKHFALTETSPIPPVLQVDPFVYDCLLHFVQLVHVLKHITDTATFVAIMQQLQTQFLIKFLLCLRAVSEKERVIVRILGNVKLDLDFFVEVFEASDVLKLDDYCLNLVQILLGHIEKTEALFTDLHYTPQEIQQKLLEALHSSAIEFSCFR